MSHGHNFFFSQLRSHSRTRSQLTAHGSRAHKLRVSFIDVERVDAKYVRDNASAFQHAWHVLLENPKTRFASRQAARLLGAAVFGTLTMFPVARGDEFIRALRVDGSGNKPTVILRFGGSGVQLDALEACVREAVAGSKDAETAAFDVVGALNDSALDALRNALAKTRVRRLSVSTSPDLKNGNTLLRFLRCTTSADTHALELVDDTYFTWRHIRELARRAPNLRALTLGHGVSEDVQGRALARFHALEELCTGHCQVATAQLCAFLNAAPAKLRVLDMDMSDFDSPPVCRVLSSAASGPAAQSLEVVVLRRSDLDGLDASLCDSVRDLKKLHRLVLGRILGCDVAALCSLLQDHQTLSYLSGNWFISNAERAQIYRAAWCSPNAVVVGGLGAHTPNLMSARLARESMLAVADILQQDGDHALGWRVLRFLLPAYVY